MADAAAAASIRAVTDPSAAVGSVPSPVRARLAINASEAGERDGGPVAALGTCGSTFGDFWPCRVRDTGGRVMAEGRRAATAG
jgi:hypothetical protein